MSGDVPWRTSNLFEQIRHEGGRQYHWILYYSGAMPKNPTNFGQSLAQVPANWSCQNCSLPSWMNNRNKQWPPPASRIIHHFHSWTPLCAILWDGREYSSLAHRASQANYIWPRCPNKLFRFSTIGSAHFQASIRRHPECLNQTSWLRYHWGKEHNCCNGNQSTL